MENTVYSLEVDHLPLKALNWAVCKAEHDDLSASVLEYPEYSVFYPEINPCTNWNQGGPIIEREEISITHSGPGSWVARYRDPVCKEVLESESPCMLVAGMRVYVKMKLGDKIKVPVRLLD